VGHLEHRRRWATRPLGSDPSNLDFGLGYDMTELLATAEIFAANQGRGGRQGGPGIVRIEIRQSRWRILLGMDAVDGEPISGIPGTFQAFVPINLIGLFNILKNRFLLIPSP
jgi:hypothetical protein